MIIPFVCGLTRIVYPQRKKSLLHLMCSGTSVFFSSLLVEECGLAVSKVLEIALVRRLLLTFGISLQPYLIAASAKEHLVGISDESPITLEDETFATICPETAVLVVMVVSHDQRCCSQVLRNLIASALVISTLWLALPQPQVTMNFLSRSLITAVGRCAHLAMLTALPL